MNNVIHDKYFYYKPSKRLSNDVNERLELIGKVITIAIKHKQFKDAREYGREKWEKYSLSIFKVRKEKSNNLNISELQDLVNFMANNEEESKDKTGVELFNLLYKLCEQYIKSNNIKID